MLFCTYVHFNINRDILECKSVRGNVAVQIRSHINRDILECKLFRNDKRRNQNRILIETYWNVNTWKVIWNITTLHINRDILECKCRLFDSICNLTHILIETYWNVNVFLLGFTSSLPIILIETYWNVNSHLCNHKRYDRAY